MRAEFMMRPPGAVAPDPSLRVTLLQYFVHNATASELADWLTTIGQDPKGTAEERRGRVLAHSKYSSMPAAELPRQTLNYLETYSTAEHLQGICETLRLSPDGPREQLWRRIMREVGCREGWLPKFGVKDEASITADLVRPYVEWHLVAKRPQYEKDFYPAFFDDMEEVFGSGYVHEQLPVASGTTLRIDFHIGHPQHGGVGIEIKMPASNSDLQRALGQMDQYQACYGDQMLVVLLSDFLNKAQETLFTERLAEKHIAVIVK